MEGLRDLVPLAFEAVEGASNVCEIREVVGLEHLALDDREVDLHLVEPTGVHGQVDEGEVRSALLEPLGGLLPRCEEPLLTIQKTRLAEA
jgi:hypothetical protein